MTCLARHKAAIAARASLKPIEGKLVGRIDELWSGVLEPLFPVGSFTPNSQCPHHGPIRPGSSFCCMVCFRSGMDDLPMMRRHALFDPRPESKPADTSERDAVQSARREGDLAFQERQELRSRRDRRAAIFGGG